MSTPHQRIYLTAFLTDFAVMISITVLPFYIFNEIGGGAAMSGTIGAIQGASYAGACLLSSRYVSKAKNGLTWALAGMVVFGLTSVLIPMSRNPIACGAAATVSMGSLALVWPALHSWVGAEPDPKQRAKRMSAFNISWSFGFALSPLVAGPLYDYDYRIAFVVLFAVAIVCVALIRTLPHEKDHHLQASLEMLEARASHDRASEAHLYAAWCATFVGSALGGVTRNVFPKRIDELVSSGQLRILFEEQPAALLVSGAATKYSWLAFALALTAAISFLILGRTRRWHHSFSFLAALQVAGAAAFWVLGSTRSLVIMALCFVAVGALGGGTFFAGVYYSMANPDHKHRRAAINEGAVGLGGFLGCLVFGYLAGTYGLATPFHWTPVFMIIALAIQLGLLHLGSRRTAVSAGKRPHA